MLEFVNNDNIGLLAAILTIFTMVVGVGRWVYYYFAKPIGTHVKKSFNIYDAKNGMAYLVKKAEDFDPTIIVGINRGGAIVGGIIGKNIGKFVYIIEVDIKPESRSAYFHRGEDFLNGKKVLLVDERLNTGKHMEEAYQLIKKHATDVRKIVFADVKRKKEHYADWYAYTVEDIKIPLPWEIGETREWKK